MYVKSDGYADVSVWEVTGCLKNKQKKASKN